jgi:hypothetical protein
VVVAANGELRRRVATLGGFFQGLSVWGSGFADAALVNGLALGEVYSTTETDWTGVADAGVVLALRGRLYDRDVGVRLDLPIFVSSPGNAVGRRPADHASLALRWELSW